MAKFLHSFQKIAALTVALLAIGLSVNAQTWYIMGEYIWSPPNPQGTFEVSQTLGNDVTIGGLIYTTVYENDALIGAFRNDGYQVYYCKYNGSAYEDEVMLYDYELEEGDFFNDDDDHPMQVTEVSTITDYNGLERKKISFMFIGLPDEQEYWIEGVGSSRGFANSGRYTPTDEGAIFHLLCYHEDWMIIYVNPVYNSCDVNEIVENNANLGVNVYPNPASEIVNILNDSDMIINDVEIIDLTGRTVLKAEKCDNIDISALAEGQYFVKLSGSTTLVKKLSIIK
ncbi:MAG: T9SS type A sorting domain-containing protein [Bacteroidales bacterium]|nr:T9SS type A sorting domain-containing protein [Bacteroidales bacterium]MBR4138143.1 T9SS type A sorting domain-containing protein [Bacteroidales bacterium]